MAKSIGGGLTASAVGGRADLMKPDAHGGKAPLEIMTTYGGNLAAMAAGPAGWRSSRRRPTAA